MDFPFRNAHKKRFATANKFLNFKCFSLGCEAAPRHSACHGVYSSRDLSGLRWFTSTCFTMGVTSARTQQERSSQHMEEGLPLESTAELLHNGSLALMFSHSPPETSAAPEMCGARSIVLTPKRTRCVRARSSHSSMQVDSPLQRSTPSAVSDVENCMPHAVACAPQCTTFPYAEGGSQLPPGKQKVYPGATGRSAVWWQGSRDAVYAIV